MPARSVKQQKFMGLALAYKRGEIPASKVSPNVKQVAASMSEKELEKYAGTSHKGLPRKVKSTSESAMVGPRWEYEDARGVKKKGTFVKSIERSGTDVTYVFKGDDGKEDLVSGAALKKAKRIYGEATMSEKELEKYAGTKHKSLPTKVKKEAAGFKIPMDELQKIVRSAVTEVISESVHGKKNEEEGPKFTPEEKKEYMEAIAKFNEYGKDIYRSSKLVETAKRIKKIVEFASKHIMDESGDWFDKVILTRHSKKMNESLKIFEKTAEEMSRLQQRMESVYEEIGETLGKYYEIK